MARGSSSLRRPTTTCGIGQWNGHGTRILRSNATAGLRCRRRWMPRNRVRSGQKNPRQRRGTRQGVRELLGSSDGWNLAGAEKFAPTGSTKHLENHGFRLAPAKCRPAGSGADIGHRRTTMPQQVENRPNRNKNWWNRQRSVIFSYHDGKAHSQRHSAPQAPRRHHCTPCSGAMCDAPGRYHRRTAPRALPRALPSVQSSPT